MDTAAFPVIVFLNTNYNSSNDLVDSSGILLDIIKFDGDDAYCGIVYSLKKKTIYYPTLREIKHVALELN